MNRTVLRIVLIVLVLVIAAGAYGWWYAAVGRFPLRGDMSHNFGTVEIHGRAASVEHTFHLRNHTDETVTIERIAQGCGCTDVAASTLTIEPGATVDIEVTLTLSKSGKKKADITLLLADRSPQKLFVYARGRQELSLWASSTLVRVIPGVPTPLIISAYVLTSDDEPDAPTIDAPEGLEVAFVKWSLVQPRNQRGNPAAQWRGQLMVELTADELAPDAKLKVALGKAEPWVFDIAVISPAPPDDATQGKR